MKRLVCLTLAVLLLVVSSVAMAQEEMSFFNEIKFGMTRKEVRNSFQGKNVTLKDEYTGGLAECLSVSYATLATYSKVLMRTYYNEYDKLYAVDYEFSNDSVAQFNDFEALLTAKYGETPYSSKTNTRMYMQNGARLYKLSLDQFTDIFGKPINVLGFSQRLLTYDDGSAVLVEHMIEYSDLTGYYYHTLDYKYFAPEQMYLLTIDSLDMSGF